MIGEQNSQDSGFKNVSTKVPVWVADLLNIICKARGTDIYGLLKLVLEFIIETAKVNGPVPPQMQTLLNMLKMDVDWNKAFAFSDPTAQMDVAQVILILQQHDGKQPRHGFGLCMIDKPFLPGETPTMTLCVDDILERVVEITMAGLYKQLRKVGETIKSESLRETLTVMCDEQLLHYLRGLDANEMPGFGDRHDYGKVIEYDQKYKRLRHRTPDSLANSQQRIHFDESDVPDLPELQDNEGEFKGNSDEGLIDGVRPFDVEY
jgi:hypothetical protein